MQCMGKMQRMKARAEMTTMRVPKSISIPELLPLAFVFVFVFVFNFGPSCSEKFEKITGLSKWIFDWPSFQVSIQNNGNGNS